MIKFIRKSFFYVFSKFVPELRILKEDIPFHTLKNKFIDSKKGENVKIYSPYFIHKTEIADFSYLSMNSSISMTNIGKFCSIGPNLVCGKGMHPTNGISTAPMFYSKENLSNGLTISPDIKFKEREFINIGNDVFIGANVTILDGVTIGNGAVIGAGSVVSKDIPPYAIAIGSPINIIRFRFQKEIIDKLQKLKWWDWDREKLLEIETHFFDMESFLNKHTKFND